jgi:hypothetical protein
LSEPELLQEKAEAAEIRFYTKVAKSAKGKASSISYLLGGLGDLGVSDSDLISPQSHQGTKKSNSQ